MGPWVGAVASAGCENLSILSEELGLVLVGQLSALELVSSSPHLAAFAVRLLLGTLEVVELLLALRSFYNLLLAASVAAFSIQRGGILLAEELLFVCLVQVGLEAIVDDECGLVHVHVGGVRACSRAFVLQKSAVVLRCWFRGVRGQVGFASALLAAKLFVFVE